MDNKNYIYIYETPSSKEMGLIKIGDAEDVDSRIKNQLNTAGVISSGQLQYTKLYEVEAIKNDGTTFRDYQIHDILKSKGYLSHVIDHEDKSLSKSSTEWFKIDLKKAIHLINEYINGTPIEEIDIDRCNSYGLREEQEEAINLAQKFFENNKSSQNLEVLWNAKMRFGKTFAAYHLVKKMELKKVLILTYKPAVEISWKEELELHVDFKNYVFLKDNVLSNINAYLDKGKNIIAFASYQNILGEADESNIKEKHKQLFETEWDLLIVDEFHYGAATQKAIEITKDKKIAGIKNIAFEEVSEEDEELQEQNESEQVEKFIYDKRVKSKYRLYLSGTPFKALADNKFPKDAIFNWTYADEQRAKENWVKKYPGKDNPYEILPQIQLYLYKVSEDLIKAGQNQGKDEFSLNYFFKANDNNRFINENAVKKWLDLISGIIKPSISIEDELSDEELDIENSQYPYDVNSDIVKEVDHSLWYFNRKNSALAMFELLNNHTVFSTYHIILATGEGTKSGADALPPVKKAIKEHKKTITITVGKLTTGVSVPKWKAVLFLRDTDNSPENYFQTAFRVQTPYIDENGKIKDKCYIFDFSPNRSLKLLTTYSEKLSKDNVVSSSEQRITEFIKYLPVLKVYGNKMEKMDAREILTFDLSGVDAKGLGLRFISKRNIIVTNDVIDKICLNSNNYETCKSIFNKIKFFKRFNGASKKEMENIDADLISLDQNNNKIKDLRTSIVKKGEENSSKQKSELKELDKAAKERKKETEKIKELLQTLLSRLPIFMYLTHATEENIEQVLIDINDSLFRKTTGITINEFRFLIEMGLLKLDSIDGYVLKFIELENKNFNMTNEIVK